MQGPRPPRRPRTSVRMLIHPDVLQRWFRNDWRRLIVFPMLVVIFVLSVFIEGDLALAIMVTALGLLLLGLAVVIGPWQGQRRLIDTLPDERPNRQRGPRA